MPVTASCGRQVRLSTSSVRSSVIGVMPDTNGNLAWTCVAEDRRRPPRLGDALGRDLDVRARRSGSRRSPRPRCARSAGAGCGSSRARRPRRRPNARPRSRTRTVSAPMRPAAQRRREPQLVVVAAAGIEADDQRRAADPRREMIDVERQVVAARFLAGLDEDDAARMWRRPARAARGSRLSAPNMA